MLPHHIITAVHFLTIDVGHQLSTASPRIIGAAIFTGSVEHGEVEFRLDATVLGPRSPTAALLPWLDEHIDPQATIAGYDLIQAASLLARCSSGLTPGITHALAGRGRHPVIELSHDRTDDDATGFILACLDADLPFSSPNASDDFAAWMMRRPVPLVHRLELDVITVWRMAMARIEARTDLGRRASSVIEEYLTDWLKAANFPAGAIHLDSLSAAEG